MRKFFENAKTEYVSERKENKTILSFGEDLKIIINPIIVDTKTQVAF